MSDMLTLQTEPVCGCQPQQKHNTILLRAEFNIKQTQNQRTLPSVLTLLSLDAAMMSKYLNKSQYQKDVTFVVMTYGNVDPNVFHTFFAAFNLLFFTLIFLLVSYSMTVHSLTSSGAQTIQP
jgi:hypothetical protein